MKNKKQKLDQPVESYYLKRKRSLKFKRAVRKYTLAIIFLGLLPASPILYSGIMAEMEHTAGFEAIADTSIIGVLQAKAEENRAENDRLNQYDDILSTLGKMGQEIKRASIEFGSNNDEAIKLMGLSIGIANAESTLGKKFVIAYDVNCHNWWGIRKVRDDGSYLRCFIDERAGARTEASLLKRLYLDQGLDTPEKIVNKYVGNKWTEYHDVWLQNVNKYYDRSYKK